MNEKNGKEKGPGIVLAAFGTVEPTGLATYESIQKKYERAFPGCPVRLAFISNMMRDRLREKSGIDVRSPLAALADLHDRGAEDVVVQSLQVVPGDEFHRLAALVQSLRSGGERLAFHSLALGLPLLSGLEDCRHVCAGLGPLLAASKSGSECEGSGAKRCKTAAVLMGHGTGHPADGLYTLMAFVLHTDYENTFLCTLEGFPGIRELIPDLLRFGFDRVKLMPFLLVAGGHALRDMAGEGPDSWKSILQMNGFEVETSLHGLAESDGILSLFLEHTKAALKGRAGRMPESAGASRRSRKMETGPGKKMIE